jgi:hypothetical protein
MRTTPGPGPGPTLLHVIVRLRARRLDKEQLFVRTSAVRVGAGAVAGAPPTASSADAGAGTGANANAPGAQGPFSPLRNRHAFFNQVWNTNAVAVRQTAFARVFEVVLSLLVEPEHEYALRFRLCAGTPRQQQASGASDASVLAEAECPLSALLEPTMLTLPLRWAEEQSGEQAPPETTLELVALRDEQWRRILHGALLGRAGAHLVRYPVVRSLVFGAAEAVREDGAGVLASEIAVETTLSFSVPSQFLRLRLEKLVDKVQRWERLYSSARVANCRFESEALAAKNGYHFVRLSVVGAAGLQLPAEQDAAGAGTGSGPTWLPAWLGGSPSPAKGAAAAGGGSPASAGGSASASPGSAGSGSQPLPQPAPPAPLQLQPRLLNAFVRVSFLHPAGHRMAIGRTTTEPRTLNPVFRSCMCESEHVQQAGANEFGFFVPHRPDVLVVLELLDERREGLAQRLVTTPVGEACYPLAALLSSPRVGPGGMVDIPLGASAQPRDLCGTLRLTVTSNWESRPWLLTGGVADEPAFVPDNNALFNWPLRWLQLHVEGLHGDVATLNRMLRATSGLEDPVAAVPAVATMEPGARSGSSSAAQGAPAHPQPQPEPPQQPQQRPGAGDASGPGGTDASSARKLMPGELPPCIKRSTDKAAFDLGAVPTNLHMSFLVLETLRKAAGPGPEPSVSCAEPLAAPPPPHTPTTATTAAALEAAASRRRRRHSMPDLTLLLAEEDASAESSAAVREPGRPALPSRLVGSPRARTPPQRFATTGSSSRFEVEAAAPAKSLTPTPTGEPMFFAAAQAQADVTPPATPGAPVAAACGVFLVTTCGAPAAHCFGFSTGTSLLAERARFEAFLRDASPWSPWLPEDLPLSNLADGAEMRRAIESWQNVAVAARRHYMRETVVLSQALSTLAACFCSELLARLAGLERQADHVTRWEVQGERRASASSASSTRIAAGSGGPSNGDGGSNSSSNSAAAGRRKERLAAHSRWFRQLHEVGFLVAWESLVTPVGKELGMLEDSLAALEAVQRGCRIRLVPAAGEATSAAAEEGMTVTVALDSSAAAAAGGLDWGIALCVALDPHALALVRRCGVAEEDLADGIRVVPVLFTQGINEAQTLATFSLTENPGFARQFELNRQSLRTLLLYFERYQRWLKVADARAWHAEIDALTQAITQARLAVESQQKGSKDVHILQAASIAARALNGSRCTFCKSGKDRTAMSITIEHARLLRTMPDAHDTDLRALDLHAAVALAREFGDRIVVAEKNIGRPNYSFNAAQRQMLPPDYRPPTSTIQDFLTSVSARDS